MGLCYWFSVDVTQCLWSVPSWVIEPYAHAVSTDWSVGSWLGVFNQLSLEAQNWVLISRCLFGTLIDVLAHQPTGSPAAKRGGRQKKKQTMRFSHCTLSCAHIDTHAYTHTHMHPHSLDNDWSASRRRFKAPRVRARRGAPLFIAGGSWRPWII